MFNCFHVQNSVSIFVSETRCIFIRSGLGKQNNNTITFSEISKCWRVESTKLDMVTAGSIPPTMHMAKEKQLSRLQTNMSARTEREFSAL